MKIIARDINNLTDARYFAAWNVDFIGLNINPGADEYISPEYFHALQEWIEGPQYALQIDQEMLAEKEAFVSLYKEDAYLILKDQEATDLKDKTIIELDLKAFASFEALKSTLADVSAYFAVIINGEDLSYSQILGHLKVEESQWLKFLKEFPIFISLNFDAASIVKCLEAEIFGICVSGGEEEAVGVKSFDDLDLIFENIESYQNIES